MKRRTMLFVCGMSLLTLVGCAGKGEVVMVNIPAEQPAAVSTSVTPQGLRVAVETFEDSRQTKARLGTRSHLWGGESHFDVPGGSSSDAATQALVRYLNRHGWQARVVKPGTALSGADLTISGHLQALSVDAKSRVGSTKLTTTSKITIRALNGADGSAVRMTLNGAGSDSVFWFEPKDAEQLINTMLDDSFARLFQSTKVEGTVLRLRD